MREFIKLTLAEQDYTFRALDLDQIEAMEPHFETINQSKGTNGLMDKEVRAAMAELVCASLKFKHPDITPERARTLVTMGTFKQVL